jgi:membrane protease YdiL (CAAX protease family)
VSARGAWSWGGVGAVVLWGTAQVFFLLMPPLVGAPFNLALAALFVWWFVTRPRARADLRRRATLRLRDMDGAARWLPLLALALVAHVLAYMVFFPRFVPLPPPDPGNPIELYLLQPHAWVGMLTLAAVIAPLLEEFLFRGWLQRTLERRHTPVFAVVATAVVFALAHFDTFGFLVRLSFGLLVGYVAYASRSIWPGVVLHGAYNAGLIVASGAVPEVDEATITRWAHTPPIFWSALAVWLVSAAVLAWGAAGLAATARRARRARQRVISHALSA